MPQGDPGALESLAAELEGHASDTDSLASQTARTTADVKTNADWTGSAAEGYSSFTANLTHGIGSVPPPLAKIASSVRGYAGYLRTAQEKVSAYNSSAKLAAATQHPTHTAAAQAAQKDAQSAVNEANAAGDQAARDVNDAKDELENPFGKDGIVRKWIEKIHAPWDTLAGDAAVGRAMAEMKQVEDLAKDARAFQTKMPGLVRNAGAELESVLDATDADISTRVAATNRLIDDMDAIWKDNATRLAGAEKGIADLSRSTAIWKGVGIGSDALGIVGDGYTLWKPEDGGTMGNVDRGVAGVNMALSGADLLGLAGATAEVPVAGQVILIGTGVYLGGDYLYHHWTPFRNVCNDVGHATIAGADHVAHAVSSGAKDIWHGITSL